MKYHDAWQELLIRVDQKRLIADSNRKSAQHDGSKGAVFKAKKRAYQDVLDMMEELEWEFE